jgi:hypothetical protein
MVRFLARFSRKSFCDFRPFRVTRESGKNIRGSMNTGDSNNILKIFNHITAATSKRRRQYFF